MRSRRECARARDVRRKAGKVARRGSGEGTVRQRADGRWEARLRLANGERQSIFARTQHDAIAKLRAKRDEQDAGLGDGSEPLANDVGVICDHHSDPPCGRGGHHIA